jgi:hypothetical protein
MFQLSEKKEIGSRPVIQPSLKIGQPGDKYEQEADAVAERVMRMSETETMQMQPVEEEEEMMQPKLRMQPVEEEEEMIQMKCEKCEKEEEMLQPKSEAGNVATPSIEKQIHSSIGNGINLPDTINQFMSSTIGSDFSRVKIYTDSNAVQMNRQLQARAFTYGNNIYFNSGEYRPESSTGKNLLAHELTHVVQQGGALLNAEKGISRKAALNMRVFPRLGQNIKQKADKMISKGEKWDAFWGVGPFDALTAKNIADLALEAAINTGLPGLHNGPADAWRHCFWNCEMTKEIGRDQAKIIADNHEKHGSGPAVENLMDARNNWEGRECGTLKSECDNCCQDKLDSATLDVIVNGKMVPSSKTARTGGKQSGY